MKLLVRRQIKSKRYARSLGGDTVLLVFLLAVGAFMLLPFIYALVQAVKPMEELFIYPPRFLVQNPTVDNFRELFRQTNSLWVPFERYVFNSVLISLVATVGHVLLASMAAYPLAKFRFPGSAMLSSLVVVSLLFVNDVTALPRYIIFAKFNMVNTYWVMILPAIASSLGLYLMQQFMSSIPDALIESAKIDGAGTFRTFWSIIMPNCKPGWMTLIIFCFQSIWNSQSTYIYSEPLKVLPTIFSQIASSGFARVGVGSAAAVLLMIPPIAVFLISQNNVIETMASSGIKG